MKNQQYTGIGKIIKTRREALGITAAELGRRIGVYPSSITRLEAGEVSASKLNTIRAIATALDIPLTELLAESNVLTDDDLPRLTPYLRTKYKDMPESAIREIEQHFAKIAKRHGITPNHGPGPGQDE
ncbi:helix-turn-helix domain-containing protein [Psychromicrobium xiongbiense]|uniref:helix-turn-helix domain-containing protein n=1 Tax=Psychromicrobium xiongbiense TaxID=3051184 RepID=UPI002553EF99|nr:helix-turn-helix transcriptional regulator [Psychromicrobium sp. YIM S02556]